MKVAAEDDYIAHDEEVANDFAPMLEHGLVDSIGDHRVYNLSVRSGRSNSHHSAGHLVHPVAGGPIAGWV